MKKDLDEESSSEFGVQTLLFGVENEGETLYKHKGKRDHQFLIINFWFPWVSEKIKIFNKGVIW